MIPFATIDDLEADGQSLQAAGVSEEAANTLLERVSAFLASQLDAHGVAIDVSDELQMINLATVTCFIVWDEVNKQASPDYSSLSQSVGSTSVSFSMPTKGKGYYIPDEYKTLLGIKGRGGYKMLRPAIRMPDGTPASGW